MRYTQWKYMHYCIYPVVSVHEKKMDNSITNNRIIRIIALAALSILIPLIATIILIIATGDRIEGMKLGVFPGIVFVHLIFGYFFVRKKMLEKVLVTITLSTLVYGIVLYMGTNEIMIKTGLDKYGSSDLTLLNFIVGLVVWEIYLLWDNRKE